MSGLQVYCELLCLAMQVASRAGVASHGAGACVLKLGGAGVGAGVAGAGASC
jgi:hypothetical protein